MTIKIIPNKQIFLFDIDGTLTEPRVRATIEFEKKFIKWAKKNNVVLVTGSDFEKVKEQLSQELLNNMIYIFCCMGNELRLYDGRTVYSKNFNLTPSLEEDLKIFLKRSPFPYRTSNHIEKRPGMVNFSIVGREATVFQRKEYNEWDKINKERKSIANFINSKYPNLEASIGGSISIDIIPTGNDKSQVIEFLNNYLYSGEIQSIVFFGDRTEPGGNDYGIVKKAFECKNIKYHTVSGPRDTLDILKNKYFSP